MTNNHGRKMDLATISAIKEPLSIKFSYRGNETLQKACGKILSTFFERNVTLWKRSGRQHSFPFHAHFIFQFVPFSSDILINYKSHHPKKWEEAALLHFFFLCPTTVEEYRHEYRNVMNEWFSHISKVESTEWLIVFDSSKAREKKNRGALIERIKSDFSKFTNRIIEIHDTANIAALQSNVQTHLLNALEDYVTYEENVLAKRNGKYSDNNFDFIGFCREQMSLSRLYQSLGIFEQVVAILDELDAMLSLIVLYHSQGDSLPKWLVSSNSIMDASPGCPLFIAMLKCEALWENITIVELRHIILAHQILAKLRIYEERLQRFTTSDETNSQNLKAEFAVILLRYSQHCLNSVIEFLTAFKMFLECDELQCWIVAFCLESLQLTSLLTEITHVEQAAYFTCSLKLAQCQAMSKLNHRWHSVDWKRISEWFENGVARCGTKNFETNAVNEIRQLLSSHQQFIHYMQKYHESSIALLKHFGWRREARAIGWELGKFLLSSDRAEGALPYLLNFVSDLIAEGSSCLLLRETLMFTVNQLEKFPGIHLKELVDFYIILMNIAKTEEQRMHYCEKFLELGGKINLTKLRLKLKCMRYKVFSFGFCSHYPFFTGIPEEIVTLNVKIINHLPKSLNNFKLHCRMKLYIQNGLEQQTAGRRPHFQCIYSEADRINRFVCAWKGDIAVRKESSGEFEINSVLESQNALIFRNCATDELHPGENVLTLISKASEVGTYYFDHFELELGCSLILRCEWVDVPEIEMDPAQRPICFINRKPVSVKLKPPINSTLIAGVAQHIELEVSSGTGFISDENSALRVSCPAGNDLEFWDVSSAKWSRTCIYSLGNIHPGNSITISIYLCKLLRNLSNGEGLESREPPASAEQVLVSWMDKEWQFTIDFVSFIAINSQTSLLEEKVLFEIVILRSNDEWLIIPQEAVLTRTADESPQVPAKLLSPKLTNIQPGSRYRLVWILPKSKKEADEVEDYELQFTYRVKSLIGCSDELKTVYDREYVLVDEFSVPNIAPNYELCAQVLSSQPGAVLCRVDNACDLIVSLRSLTNRVETVIVSVDADPRFWFINERHKLLYVKESGLGQISFTVIPKMVGFLPYPFIAVYGCGHEKSVLDISRSSGETNNDFGPRLSSFVRTNGKQVHVLGAFATPADYKGASDKTSRLREAKSRLTKLFD